jgi:cyclopropane fatty-acyl-phospholipid synthase-like methyltransferase
VGIRLIKSDEYKRKSDDRLFLIKKYIPVNKISSYLDVGSQLGYFVFQLAKHYKIPAVGIDQDIGAYFYSEFLKILNNEDRVNFNRSSITPESAKALGAYDLITLLSVFHHLVKYQGFQQADRIVDELVSKCNYFVFETGQADEKNMVWSEDLSFMKESSQKWIEKYLVSKKLIILHHSEVSTHLSEVKRHFFVCKRHHN